MRVLPFLLRTFFEGEHASNGLKQRTQQLRSTITESVSCRRVLGILLTAQMVFPDHLIRVLFGFFKDGGIGLEGADRARAAKRPHADEAQVTSSWICCIGLI
jgi:hypothetical protein